ncbi:MAG: YbhB/YbcL family Raf kinase inhibitor-like protein [Stenotrophobium sp.]
MHRMLIAALLSVSPVLVHAAGNFTLGSPDIGPGAIINSKYVFKGFGCEGGNVSPALQWSNAPAGTQSFAITAYDPDAPTGSGWWHWVVFDIPASATGLAEGAGNIRGTGLPAGSVQGRTDFGAPGYGGPCPPAGDKPHHYIFTVYALKVPKLQLDANASAAMVGFMLNANQLGKTSFTALYSRK